MVEERAERAVRAKDEAAKRTAMEERLRIARELHDSLTHSISVIQVQAGVAVHLANKRGEPDVDQAAYRIVQEALTNVSRHAGLARAKVRLHYAPGALTVQVGDDGNGAGSGIPGPGLGLVGMRERVSVLGGRLHAGPQDGGGFLVRAELPLPAVS